MTKIDWDRRESLRIRLAELLEQEPLKEALQVCLSLELDSPQHFSGAADLLHQAALSGAAREGYFRFFRNLKALTKAVSPQDDMPKPWDYLNKPPKNQ